MTNQDVENAIGSFTGEAETATSGEIVAPSNEVPRPPSPEPVTDCHQLAFEMWIKDTWNHHAQNNKQSVHDAREGWNAATRSQQSRIGELEEELGDADVAGYKRGFQDCEKMLAEEPWRFKVFAQHQAVLKQALEALEMMQGYMLPLGSAKLRDDAILAINDALKGV